MSALRIIAIALGLFVAGSLVVTPVTLATACVAASATTADDHDGAAPDLATSDALPGDPCNMATERGEDESAHVVPWIPTDAIVEDLLMTDSRRANTLAWSGPDVAASFIAPCDAPPPRS